MFFNGWFPILRVLVVGTLTYLALILLLRISGKRTLSKMNMFDFVITVALGSTFATIILSRDVALAEGVAALALLILLQFLVAWLSVRSDALRELVKGEPALLFYQGEFIARTMWQERVTREDVTAAIRSQGIAELAEVGAVVIETDGSLTILPRIEHPPATALENLQMPDAVSEQRP